MNDHGRLERLLALRHRLHADGEADCPGLYDLAACLAGVAGEIELQRSRRHLATCRACAALVADFEALQTDGSRPVGQTRRRWRFPVFAWASVCLILVAGAGLGVYHWLGMDPDATAFAIKGPPDAIAVAVKRGKQKFRARRGTELSDGDRLGFFYTASKDGYLALFSIEADGQATVLYPATGERSGQITAGENIKLPDEGLLHKPAGCEWLAGVFSDEPITIETIRRYIREAASAQGPNCPLPLALPQARTVWIFPLR